MTAAWLRQALLKDRTAVSSQAEVCFRVLTAAVAGCLVLGVLLLLSALGGIRGLVVLLAVLEVIALGVFAYLAVWTRRVLADQVFGPLNDLATSARRVAGGDLEAVGQPYGPLEMQQITAAMGTLAGALVHERSSRAADRAASQGQAMTLRQLLRQIQEIGSSLDADEVAVRLAQGMLAVSGHRRAVVWFVDPDDARIVPSKVIGAEPASPVLPIMRGEGPVGRAVANAQTIQIRAGDGGEAGMVVPLVRGLEVAGAVELRDETQRTSHGPDLIDALETLASFGSASIAAARLHQEVELRSETDGLTKVFNRRKLEIDLKAEVARSLRYGRPLSLIMVDVDHFKSINDTFGHQQGDEVLKLVAQTIGRRSRETDSAYRYGGEEFAVLLRETEPAAAAEIAERLRNRIREGLTVLELGRDVTASLGVAAVSQHIRAAEQLVEAADEALYRAKETGRNKVVLSPRV